MKISDETNDNDGNERDGQNSTYAQEDDLQKYFVAGKMRVMVSAIKGWVTDRSADSKTIIQVARILYTWCGASAVTTEAGRHSNPRVVKYDTHRIVGRIKHDPSVGKATVRNLTKRIEQKKSQEKQC